MLAQIRAALVSLVFFTLLTGVAYPLLVTGVALTVFPRQARGSVLVDGGKERGSLLIGQPFTDPRYFWGRPSATNPPYNGGSSSGSNLGPTNPALIEAVKARVQALRDADPDNHALVPIDLVTASASGLDPHISPAAAEYQIARVAGLRRDQGLDEAKIRALVASHTEARQFGILGEPRVNVLALNLALDAAR